MIFIHDRLTSHSSLSVQWLINISRLNKLMCELKRICKYEIMKMINTRCVSQGLCVVTKLSHFSHLQFHSILSIFKVIINNNIIIDFLRCLNCNFGDSWVLIDILWSSHVFLKWFEAKSTFLNDFSDDQWTEKIYGAF